MLPSFSVSVLLGWTVRLNHCAAPVKFWVTLLLVLVHWLLVLVTLGRLPWSHVGCKVIRRLVGKK